MPTNKAIIAKSIISNIIINIFRFQLFRNLDSSAKEKPDISAVRNAMQEVIHEMDMSYGLLGSLFRSGSRQTFFSSQVVR